MGSTWRDGLPPTEVRGRGLGGYGHRGGTTSSTSGTLPLRHLKAEAYPNEAHPEFTDPPEGTLHTTQKHPHHPFPTHKTPLTNTQNPGSAHTQPPPHHRYTSSVTPPAPSTHRTQRTPLHLTQTHTPPMTHTALRTPTPKQPTPQQARTSDWRHRPHRTHPPHTQKAHPRTDHHPQRRAPHANPTSGRPRWGNDRREWERDG